MPDYRSTIFLPTTSFPMKGNMGQREPEILKKWDGAYEKKRALRHGKEKFVLHDGPPFANGHLHTGHVYNKVLKDFFNRSFFMKGYDTPYIPGWDCHGLPIEAKIEEDYRAKGLKKDQVPVVQFRQDCRAFAAKWLDIQRQEFKRLGVDGDWDNPYSTMAYENEGKIVELLGQFLLDGYLVRGVKPILWSVTEKTALAEAEVEYKEKESRSIYVAFEIKKTSLSALEGAFVVIWTTTPWTLPGNRAIAYGESFAYGLYGLPDGRKILLAKDLAPQVLKLLGVEEGTCLLDVSPEVLGHTVCAHPLEGYTFEVPLLPGEHVTVETGTGFVHTAPGHGLEDFVVGKKFNLEIPETVTAEGVYADHVPLFKGVHVYKADPIVIEALGSFLLYQTKIVHSYPHSWRSKTPLIFRTTPQWFVKMDHNDLRDRALSAIDDVEWFPSQGKNRIKAMVQNRPDWCISRQRTWGVPIPIFVHKKTGEPLKDSIVMERVVEAVKKEGADVWFREEADYFLSPDYSSHDYEKVADIVDVWFESGSTQAFVLKDNPDLSWPCDLYLEGSDQHRGWFQSSLMVACALEGRAPFKNVFTHGFVVDGKGYKLSKSLGNDLNLPEILQKSGADLLRLWVGFTDSKDDMSLTPEILKRMEDVYRRFRNILRYLLGALHGYHPETEAVAENDLPDLEKWVLHRLWSLNELHKKVFTEFDPLTFHHALHQFCAVDLSAFYLDIRKDTLYCDAETSSLRRSARTVMAIVLETLLKWLAPLLPFTAEEAWSAFAEGESIHMLEFTVIPESWENRALEERFEEIRLVRKLMTGALEAKRAEKVIGSSLEAHIDFYGEIRADLLEYDWKDMAIISSITFHGGAAPEGAFTLEENPAWGALVRKAEGDKCDRCWKILPEVGSHKRHATLCHRCVSVVEENYA